jgi:hypothetical protein
MANENQEQLKNLQETAESLRVAQQNLAAAQLPVNQGFKESVNLLTKINNLISDSASKTSSFEKSTINVKRIQTEQERVERKRKTLVEQIQQANQADKTIAEAYITNVEKRKNLEEDIIKKRSVGNFAEADALTQQLTGLETAIKGQETSLQQEQLSLITKIQSEKALAERVENVKKELEEEKKIKKELGLTGGALKLLNKYLLVGKDTYGKMVEEARDGDKTTKKWVATVGILSAGVYGAYKAFGAFADIAKSGMDSLTGSGGPISKFISPFSNLIKQIPLIGGLLGGVVDILANVADYATEAGSQVQLFGRNLGLSFTEAKKLNAQYSDLTLKSGNLLYNAKKFRETQLEIAEATGLNNLLSEKALQTQIDLKEIFGIDLETRKQLVDTERVSGVQQDKIVKAAMGTSNFISKTLGVSIKWQSILKEASSLSGVLGLRFAKYPEELTRSLGTVKAMGLELKQLDSLADSFLDFESSISKEFEAQLLTGKDINLAKAREAFLNNDLVTAGKELVAQLGTSGEFLRYNRIQQDALAASAGMTKDQVADMLKQQELFSRFQVNDIKAYQQKVALMSKTIEGQKELVGLLGEEEYSKVMSQTATEKIANFIEKIKQSFADLLGSSSFQGFLDKFLSFISDPKQIENIISKVTGFISMMIQGLSYMVDAADIVVRVLTLGIKDIPNDIAEGIRGFGTEIGSMKLGTLSSKGVSIGENAANSEVKGSTMNNPTPSENMSMSKPIVNVINNTKVDAIKGQSLSDVAVQWSYGDANSGQQRFQSMG